MKHKLENQLNGISSTPNEFITKSIDSGEFPFSKNKIIGYEPGLLAFEEFKRCLESIMQFKDPSIIRLLQVKEIIERKEKEHHKELENIVTETIRELFDVPDFISINSTIESDIDFDQNPPIKIDKEISNKRKEEMQDAIESRIFLNSLVHGSAIHVYKSAHYIIDKKLKDIDPELLPLYNEYSALINFGLWQTHPGLAAKAIKNKDEVPGISKGMEEMLLSQGISKEMVDKVKNITFVQGCEKIELGDNTINAHAINLPVLFHELTKGVVDFLISKGIPQDYTEDELKYYYSQADKYEDEIWHYYLGASLWVKFIEALNVSTQELPEKISIISQMSYKDLVDLFTPIIDGDDDKIKIKLKLYGLK